MTTYLDSLSDTLNRTMARGRPAHDLSKYPDDVRPFIESVCNLWYLKPPRTKKSKAYWIQSARELEDACGEFGIELLGEYRKDFENKMIENQRKTGHGTAPHTVEGPGSLVKMLRDKARQKREEGSARDWQNRRYEEWGS